LEWHLEPPEVLVNRARGRKTPGPDFISENAFYDVFLVEDKWVLEGANHRKTNDSSEFMRRKINFPRFVNRTPYFL
jgi:hypothetical protein